MTAKAHYGMSHSGKSWAFKRMVEARARKGAPTIVFDRIHEWCDRDGMTELDVPVCHASTEAGLQRWIEDQPAAVLVYKPPDIFEGDPMAPSEDMIRAACVLARTCLQIGAVFVSAEAHRIAPNGGRLPRVLDELAGAGRHYGAQWWADTQAFSLLSTRVRRQAVEVRVFTMAEPQELDALRGAYGPEMVDAVRACGQRMRAGAHGWFVHVDPWNAEPPWSIGRFDASGVISYDRGTPEAKDGSAREPSREGSESSSDDDQAVDR